MHFSNFQWPIFIKLSCNLSRNEKAISILNFFINIYNFLSAHFPPCIRKKQHIRIKNNYTFINYFAQ